MTSARAQANVVPPCDLCDLCGSQEEVNWFCNDCQENICNRCKIGHQRGRKTKNDEIVPVVQAKYQTAQKMIPILCHEHKTKVCELYCKNCKQPICSQCLNIKHKSHEFDSVEKLMESKTSELNDFEKRLHSKLSSYENLISEESKNLSKFLSHVDKLKKEVKDETDKIIQEFNQTRNQLISDLSQLNRRAEQMYKRNINNNESKFSNIKKLVDDVQNAKTSGDLQAMIRIVNELEQKIVLYELPTVSILPLPNFKHNACRPSSILQLDIPDIKVVASQQPPVMPVSRTGGVAMQTIDMNNVKVSEKIQVHGKSESILAICPIDNSKIWIAMYPDNNLTLVDTHGSIIKTTDVGSEIWDAVCYYTYILCTTRFGHCVTRVSKDGDSVTTFSNLSPFYTCGLCVAVDKSILVCVKSTDRYNDSNCKVIRLNSSGEITQEIKHSNQEPLFRAPMRVTSPGTGDVVVVDCVLPDVRRLICTDQLGNHRYTWTGQVGGTNLQKFTLSRMAHNNNSVYVTDELNHCVYVLDRNGKAEQFALDRKYGMKDPVAITINNKGRLWLGCRGAKLYELQ